MNDKEKQAWLQQDREFQSMHTTINEIFIHHPKKYYEFPEVKNILVLSWKAFSLTGMALKKYCTINDIKYPIKNADFAKCMAFLIFVFKCTDFTARKNIINIVQNIREKLSTNDRNP